MKRNSVELIHKLTALFLCISLILTPSDLRQILNDSFRALEMSSSAEEYESDDSYADQSISAKGIVERNEDGDYSAVIESSGIRVAVSFTDEAGIHHLVAAGTIDEDIMKVLENKDKTQAAMMKAVKARVK